MSDSESESSYESSDDDIYEPNGSSSDEEMVDQNDPGPSNLADVHR